MASAKKSGASLLYWILYYPVEKLLAKRTSALITINDEDYERARKLRLRQGGIVRKIPGVGIETEKFGRRSADRDAM